MGAIGFLVLWAGYAVFYYGFDQIRGGNNGFLDLAIPGRYKALPTDAQIGNAPPTPPGPGAPGQPPALPPGMSSSSPVGTPIT